jgi:hypothetical protein
MIRLILIIASLIATPAMGQAPQDFKSGNAFLRACTPSDRGASCLVYTLGVYHGFREGSDSVCLPKGVDTGQLLQVGLAFIRENPKAAHYGPGGLMVASWIEAFPCSKIQK